MILIPEEITDSLIALAVVVAVMTMQFYGFILIRKIFRLTETPKGEDEHDHEKLLQELYEDEQREEYELYNNVRGWEDKLRPELRKELRRIERLLLEGDGMEGREDKNTAQEMEDGKGSNESDD